MSSWQLEEELETALRRLKKDAFVHGGITLFMAVFLGGVALACPAGVERWVMLVCAVALLAQSVFWGYRIYLLYTRRL